jgi:tetratricopeptide (TPR) repeat protein
MRRDERAGKHDGDTQTASYYRAVLTSVALAGLVLQAASLGPLRDGFWGFHLFAFLPFWATAFSWSALVIAGVWLLYSPAWNRGGVGPANRVDPIPAIWAFVLALLCAVAFWTFRSHQTLLGDGLPLTIDLPKGQSFHPRQPLAMWFQQFLYRTVGDVVAGGETAGNAVAHLTVAAGSVVAGALFVLTVFALGRVLLGGAGRSNSIALLATLTLLTQGYAVLFFGYVENYAYYSLTISLYLLTSALYLRRRIPLCAAAVSFVVGIGVHLSTVALLPSFLFLTGWGVRRQSTRVDAVTGFATAVVGVLMLDVLLRQLSPGYSLWGGVGQIFGIVRTTQGGGAGLPYMFSWDHLRDFLNDQYLIGPLAALLFLPALAYAVGRRALRDPTAIYLTLAAGVYLVGSWVTSEPLLGYARDWDLFAPPAVCYCAAGLYFLVSHVASTARARRLLGFAVLLSVLYLAPWVAINHSEALTLERFKTLPLGHGKTEVAVANWYMRNEQNAEAELWFKRALEVAPGNVNAYFLLGMLYARDGLHDRACKFFDAAVKIRPDKPNYRRRYADALLESGRCQDAVVHLTWLSERIPLEYGYWQTIGANMIRLGCGERLAEIYAPVLAEVDRHLQRDPGNVDIVVYAGILLGNVDRFEEALEQFGRALALEPDLPAGLFNTGMALMKLERYEEALWYFERFVALHPDHPMHEFVSQMLATTPQNENE